MWKDLRYLNKKNQYAFTEIHVAAKIYLYMLYYTLFPVSTFQDSIFNFQENLMRVKYIYRLRLLARYDE